MKSKCYHSKRGFTLVELLITITIISVLTTVSVVGYVSFINKANEARDQAMVDQLNRLKQAYEVENGKTLTNEDLSEILTDNGISFNDASPTSDGQKLYYDHESNAFVLGDADNPEGKDHLTEINEEFLSGNTTTPSEETQKPSPAIKAKYTSKSNSTLHTDSEKSIELEDGVLNIGNVKDDFVELDINEILENVDGEIDLTCTPVATVDYGYTHDNQGDTHHISDDNIITFYCSGRYKLTISCGDLDETITVNVDNSACDKYVDAELSTNGSASIYAINYNSDTKTSSIILHIFGGIIINDYSSNDANAYTLGLLDGDKSNNKDIQKELIDSKRLKIYIDGKEQSIQFIGNHYSIQLDNLELKQHSIEIEYRFLSYNGEWVSQAFVFSFNLTSAQANNKNISTLP